MRFELRLAGKIEKPLQNRMKSLSHDAKNDYKITIFFFFFSLRLFLTCLFLSFSLFCLFFYLFPFLFLHNTFRHQFINNSHTKGEEQQLERMKRQMMKLVPKCHQIQYIFIAALLLIDFIIIQAPTIIPRSILAALLLSSFWIPYIRKFTLPALPIFTWLITFYACQFIPIDYRPNHIFVNLLPTLERILYGANLSEVISKHTHPVLDILAWLPYGVIHFSFPFILALLLFVFGPPGCLKVYGAAFGYMNLAGVLTQLLFPNASPCNVSNRHLFYFFWLIFF